MRLSLYSVSVSLAAITASTNINFVSAIKFDQDKDQFSVENALMLSQLNTEYSNVADLDDVANSFSQLASPSGGTNALLVGGLGAVVGAVIGAGAVAASNSKSSSGEAAAVAKPTPTKAPEVTSDSKDEDKDENDKTESRSGVAAQTRGGSLI